MTLSLIAAIGTNNELGKNNALLWNMPADMKHFRDTTRGKTVIMGRKTFESIGRPLPNRRNIIITRDENYRAEGVEIFYSLESALKLLEHTSEEVFDIGGAELYRIGIEHADRLYITHIDQSFEADTFFPQIDARWKIVSEEKHAANAENPYPYTFTIYEKTA